MSEKKVIDAMWDDSPIDVSAEVNFIWSIANKLRGPYQSDKYKDVIIPMTIIRRLECALADTKQDVVETFESNKNTPALVLEQKAGYAFYNTSKFDLKELLNDSDHIASNFKSYINSFSSNVKTILLKDGLDFIPDIEKMAKNNRLLGVIKEFSTFIILSIIGLIINQVIMFVMVEKASIWYMFSKIVSTIIVMVYNFITRKIFIEK